MLIELTASVEIMPLLTPLQTKIVGVILSDYREGEPWARMTAAELASEVGVASPNLYRAIKPLRAARLLNRPSSTVWQISPHLGWRGTRKQWTTALASAPRPNLEALHG